MELKLKRVDPIEAKMTCQNTFNDRVKKHIQNVKAAGSFFINPNASQAIVQLFEKEKGVDSHEGRVPAGWLIDRCGLKGMQIGDAMVSNQQANYLINMGNAQAKNVLELADLIKKKVKKEFDLELQEEVSIYNI